MRYQDREQDIKKPISRHTETEDHTTLDRSGKVTGVGEEEELGISFEIKIARGAAFLHLYDLWLKYRFNQWFYQSING